MSGAAVAAITLCAGPAQAQRAGENAVRAAGDAFGTAIGNEKIGLYSDHDARGFSPVAAGNIRIEGLYIDNPIGFSGRFVSGSTLRVGIAAQGYPFPAPTGLSDYALRPAGDTPILTISGQVGPNGTNALSLDTQRPLVDGVLGFAGGVAYRFEEQLEGAGSEVYALGGVLHWRPNDRLLVQPFGGYLDYTALRSAPLVFTDGPTLPPVSPARAGNPDWVYGVSKRVVYGTIATYDVSDDWTVRGGLFRVENNNERLRNALLVNVQPDGAAQRIVAASQDQTYGSTSGELRATWRRDEGPRRHILNLSARARAAERSYGGSTQQSLGPTSLYQDDADLPEPTFVFGPRSHDEVRQTTLALSYTGAWADLGELTLGVQRADYEKVTRAPGLAQIVSRDMPWLYDAALAVRITDRLTAYAGYASGLEESPVAPVNAVNRNEAPPALRTSQRDAGVRYRLPANLTLVAGVFDVQKPYFNLDRAQIYRELGEVRHRGVELSLTGSPIEGLTVVAGAVFLDGEVSGELVDRGQIGPRPVGQTDRQLRLNAEYRLPWSPAWSIDLGIISNGDSAASSTPRPALGGKQFTIDGRTGFDIGARYRFEMFGARAVARAQILNVGDNTDWEVGSNGAFQMNSGRRAALTVTADF